MWFLALCCGRREVMDGPCYIFLCAQANFKILSLNRYRSVSTQPRPGRGEDWVGRNGVEGLMVLFALVAERAKERGEAQQKDGQRATTVPPPTSCSGDESLGTTFEKRKNYVTGLGHFFFFFHRV